MSLWRKKAVEMMPSLQKVVAGENVVNPMSLWIELSYAYGKAMRSEPRSEEQIDQVWKFLRWCRDEYRNDEMWVAAHAFLEGLLNEKSVREDLPKRISNAEFESFSVAFSYLNSETTVAEYRDWFFKKRRELFPTFAKRGFL